MMAPESWSPHATYAATKMFVSQLNTKQTQRFLNLVLLNKVRDDIHEHKRLHFALFQAVKKAVFKPGAFYKGFVLPLLKSGDCTLREAVIISSVLNRVSIPVDHSAAVRSLHCAQPRLHGAPLHSMRSDHSPASVLRRAIAPQAHSRGYPTLPTPTCLLYTSPSPRD